MREYLYTIAISGILAYLITPVVRSLALKSGAYMHLRTRDMHKEITPRWGGIAMWASMSLTMLVVSHLPLVGKSFGREAQGIFLAGTFVMLLGAIDDRFDLDAVTKSAGQALAGGILLLHGVQILWLPINGILTLPPAIGQVVTVVFVMLVINAVNFVDGLDGLATVPSIFALFSLSVIVYIVGNAALANYLLMPKIPAGEVVIIAMALIGSLLGFLWFNCHPAQVFMGDSGSLTLGAFIAYMGIIGKSEVLLILIGLIFVIETVSVILQVGSYKLRKKRVFLMAPIHHHFEMKQWAENKIIVRFWIIALLSNLFALITLKIR